MTTIQIKDTAFYKYLRGLPLELRAQYLLECFLAGGEMAYELAEEFNEYNPVKLAERIENGKDNPIQTP